MNRAGQVDRDLVRVDSIEQAQAIAELVTGLNDRGRMVELVADDWIARILQHEIDHLDGVLFIDRIGADLQREARRRLREQALSGVPIEPVAAL